MAPMVTISRHVARVTGALVWESSRADAMAGAAKTDIAKANPQIGDARTQSAKGP
jgi:hypothetical protein